MAKKQTFSRAFEADLASLSPFEIKNKLIELAKNQEKKSADAFLNAGRGNPNWIAYDARETFFFLGAFAVDVCRSNGMRVPGIAGIPEHADGLGDRLDAYIHDHSLAPGATLLKNCWDYAVNTLHCDRDGLAFEWVEGIIGDQYPTPPRILEYTERISAAYMAREMGDHAPGFGQEYDYFATEGGTAAMCYIFNSLQVNHLLNKGDKIALMGPIFTPYLEIPELDRFKFEVVMVSANEVERDGTHHWQYPETELDKLRDPSVKLVCCINPSNPPSYELSHENMRAIVDIVKNDNPDLMVITDDVYGTFADNFKSLMYTLPYNTLCVYSFSKYFGATGWRLAVVAAAKENVYDQRLRNLPVSDLADLQSRYRSITPDAGSLKFIDRMVADSRMVALNHTAGLSTPQQIQMSLFALKCLVDRDDVYKKAMKTMVHRRLDSLWEATGFTPDPDSLAVGYYAEIDFMVWAKKIYGDGFAQWLDDTYDPLDVTVRLAAEKGVVVLNGSGFDGPAWSVRTSQANLRDEEYVEIGKKIREIFDGYHDEYLAATGKKQ